MLEGIPRQTKAQRAIDQFLTGLILLNVVAVILNSVESISASYSGLFLTIEVLSVAIFSIEFLLRLWVADIAPDGSPMPSRGHFWRNPYTWIDLAAIVPFYLSFIVQADLRLLRLLRLFRVFRLSPAFRSLFLLAEVIKQEYRPMFSAFAVIFIMMLLAAGGIYVLESEAQPKAFGDLPSALWWVVVTLTTVGYGDVVPMTVLGKVLGGFVMILGVGMVALPAGMLASRFSLVMHEKQHRFQRRVEEEIAANGSISDEVAKELYKELHVSPVEAKSIIKTCLEESHSSLKYCPHCGERLPTD